MKTKLVLVITVSTLMMLLFNHEVFSQDKIKQTQEKQPKVESKLDDQDKKIWNAICPVMEDPVDPSVKTVEYKGKVIGFCCRGCIKKFLKDPEKYFKKISPDGKSLINK